VSIDLKPVPSITPSNSRPNLDPDSPVEDGEDRDAMATNEEEDDGAMMAMMGLSGFGTTKVLFCVLSLARIKIFRRFILGETSIRQPGRRCRCQKNADMETVHESVSVFGHYLDISHLTHPFISCSRGGFNRSVLLIMLRTNF
jgi:hypothetical protein